MIAGTALTTAAMLLSGCEVVVGVRAREVLVVESGVEWDTGSEEDEGLRMAVKSAADEMPCIWTTQKVTCPTKSVPYRGVDHLLSTKDG